MEPSIDVGDRGPSPAPLLGSLAEAVGGRGSATTTSLGRCSGMGRQLGALRGTVVSKRETIAGSAMAGSARTETRSRQWRRRWGEGRRKVDGGWGMGRHKKDATAEMAVVPS